MLIELGKVLDVAGLGLPLLHLLQFVQLAAADTVGDDPLGVQLLVELQIQLIIIGENKMIDPPNGYPSISGGGGEFEKLTGGGGL